MNSDVQFKAFISYSHTDEQWARWLHKALETYRIPARIVTSHELSSNRLTPIFRDRDELSSANDLSETIKEALESSRAGQFDDARATADRALDLLRRYSETDLAIARGLFDRANVDAFIFEYAKAEPFAREALAIRRKKGEHDAILLDSLNQLGTITLGLGKLDEAETYYQEAVDKSIEVLGELHLNTAIFKENLGNVWFRQKHYAKTIAQLDDVLAIRIEVVGESHEAVGRTLANLGSLNRVTSNLDAARGYFDRALVILETTLGGDHSDIGNLTKSLGYLEAQQNNHAVAVTHFTRSKAIMAKAHGDESWQAALLDVLLGKSLLAMDNKTDAKGHFERALVILEHHFGSDDERTRTVVEALAGIAD